MMNETMKVKERYLQPDTVVVELQAEGMICDSKKGKNNEGVSWGGGYD